MKLKDIKPGMIIHFKNDEEKKLLLEEAEKLGYCWSLGGTKPTDENIYSGMAIRFHNDNTITWSNYKGIVTEFSDLIIPDPELSAEEALLAYDQMCKENYCCNDCTIYGILGRECAHVMDGNIKEIMDAIKKWKSDHEKKAPEIETVDICRIIEIRPDGRNRCVHEEDIEPDPDLPYGGEQIAVKRP